MSSLYMDHKKFAITPEDKFQDQRMLLLLTKKTSQQSTALISKIKLQMTRILEENFWREQTQRSNI